MSILLGEWGTLYLTKKHIVLLSLRGACVPERFFNGGLMRADATSPIMSAHAQVSYLRDEKNVSFELVSEEDAVAFLEERSFFFKLKAFAKDFEKYGRKPGEKGRYVNLDFGHLVELSKLDKALRSLVLDLALDIEHYLKVRINAAAMRAGTDPFAVVDTFLESSAASVVSEQTKAIDKNVGACAIQLATSTLERCDLGSRPAIVSSANEAVATLSEVTLGRDPRHVEHAIAGMAGSPYSGALVRKYAEGPIPLWTLLELVSFGPLTRLYRHCFGKAGAIDDPEEKRVFSSYRGMLRCTQQLRNAAAHNDCLLNGLSSHEKKSGSYPKIRKALVEGYGMDSDVVAQVGSVRVAMDLAAVLICYDAYVPRGGSRSKAGLTLSAARERFAENAPWFDKTYAVKSFLDYVDALFHTFAMILDA